MSDIYLDGIKGLPEAEAIRDKLKKHNIVQLSGCVDAMKPQLIYALGQDFHTRLVVTYDEMRAKDLYEQYQSLGECSLYPARDFLFYQSDIRGNALSRERLKTTEALIEGREVTIFTTIDALLNRIMPIEAYADSTIRVCAEDSLDMDRTIKKLVRLGYERVTQVEHHGEFATRGGIVDIYPLTMDFPVRIELWGDEIDSIRSFDPESQKSMENLDSVSIYPASELILDRDRLEKGQKALKKDTEALIEKYRSEFKTEEAHRLRQQLDYVRELDEPAQMDPYLPYFYRDAAGLLDYIGEDSCIFFDEVRHLHESAKVITAEFEESMTHRLEQGYLLPKQMEMLLDYRKIFAALSKKTGLTFSTLDASDKIIKPAFTYAVNATSKVSYNNSFELLIKDLKKYTKEHFRVVIVCESGNRAKHLTESIMDEDINVFFAREADRELFAGQVMVTVGSIRSGYVLKDAFFAVITEFDIFGNAGRKQRKKKRFEGKGVSSFADLSIGDYVVHENHGLGIYRGLEKIQVDKVQKDYIKIEYAKGGNLYILASQLDSIQKYASVDSGAKKPRLNTLGGTEWARTKSNVRHAVGLVARDLVELYSKRQMSDGFVYGPDTTWQREFEEDFPYEETPGQLEAIEDVKRDMMSPKIMDRLICGDVGYGKTEIAMRAAFKAVQEGKQVVYLVPTTILAQQHFQNFESRMKNYPVTVEMLSRFRSQAQQKETVAGLKSGRVDIVIGTHRVLSDDIEYKDLGLLIIDEEQRFGVNHKEKIKKLKTSVDVLSLSATPIPRTLHMSMIGIRDMSVLEEAPLERMPIQTFVFEYNEEMVREAIVRELARGGQVYYVFNRARQIADMAARIQSLVPEARVAYAHGQMTENRLEDIMYDFTNHEIDILVSTTIIEIGLDISNVNTIIIHDSDNLGLSQLYQLRGRVGRSNRVAYAFFLYKRDKVLKEVAEKRLAAIKEFSDLGSGFKIALRDLEIRGAGNLLGDEQHGHMAAVGYDMYCKMLNEAVLTEKGIAPEDSFETSIEINVDAFLPETYVPGELQRLDIYKRIAELATDEEADELLDELIDRFGEPPFSAMNLFLIARLRRNAHKAYITRIKQRDDQVDIYLYEKAGLDAARIPAFIAGFEGDVSFSAAGKEPYFTYSYMRNSRVKKRKLTDLLEEFAALLADCSVAE